MEVQLYVYDLTVSSSDIIPWEYMAMPTIDCKDFYRLYTNCENSEEWLAPCRTHFSGKMLRSLVLRPHVASI